MSIRLTGRQFLVISAVGIVVAAVTSAYVTSVLFEPCDELAKLDVTLPTPIMSAGEIEYLYVKKDGKVIDRYRLQ